MPRPSFWHAALACRCPRCGRGSLFRGFLTLRPACNACGLSFGAFGAASGLMFLLVAAALAMAFWAALRFQVPAPFPVAIVALPAFLLAIGLMRPLKAALIAQQYRHRASEMEL